MPKSLQKISENAKFHWLSLESLTDIGTKHLPTAIGSGFLILTHPLEISGLRLITTGLAVSVCFGLAQLSKSS